MVTAQDPNDCQEEGGDRFSCLVENEMMLGTTSTSITSVVNCALNPVVGFNFLEAQNCTCQADLTDQDASRTCNCAVCPDGRLSLDCSNVADNPYVFGECTSMDCSGNCGSDSSGISTTAPPEEEPPVETGGSDTSGGSDNTAPASAPATTSSGSSLPRPVMVSIFLGTVTSLVLAIVP